MQYKFSAILDKYDNKLWQYHVKIPDDIYEDLKAKKIKRFMCSLNEGPTFHSSPMPAGKGVYFIKINKELIKANQLAIGDNIRVQISKDKSKYGMTLPVEFEEMMLQDPVGKSFFLNLTPGKQRSLLFLINKLKSENKRIEKS
jgi:Uncharacterized protein conserved in bacteria